MPNSITAAESHGDPIAKNSRSSALGLGQFVNATWLDVIRRYRPDLVQGKSQVEILELRKDPVLSQQMTDAYAAENEAKLREAGLPTTPGSTYLMHFAGPTGAVALLKADPSSPVESILSNKAIESNPFLQGKTASWVIDWANKRIATASAPKLWGGQPIPDLAQARAAEPVFGAKEWLQRPTSPNVLPPATVPPFAPSAGALRVAAIPYVDGTRRAQQALDNSPPAPGAASWAYADRFGRWDSLDGVSGPVTSSLNGGLGQTGDGNDLGAGSPRFARSRADSFNWSRPAPASQSGIAFAAAPSNGDPSSIHRLSFPMPDGLPISSEPPRVAGLSSFGSTPWSSPGQSPLDALLAADRNRGRGNWIQPLPYRSSAPPTQDAAGGIPGMMVQAGLLDPSNPDQPPAGGLLKLLREYMRNNPDDGASR